MICPGWGTLRFCLVSSQSSDQSVEGRVEIILCNTSHSLLSDYMVWYLTISKHLNISHLFILLPFHLVFCTIDTLCLILNISSFLQFWGVFEYLGKTTLKIWLPYLILVGFSSSFPIFSFLACLFPRCFVFSIPSTLLFALLIPFLAFARLILSCTCLAFASSPPLFYIFPPRTGLSPDKVAGLRCVHQTSLLLLLRLCSEACCMWNQIMDNIKTAAPHLLQLHTPIRWKILPVWTWLKSKNVE